MSDYIAVLATAVAADKVLITPELDAALRELDAEMERVAPELAVEVIGPGVGMADMNAEQVFKLVVRYHVWDVFKEGWGLKVCDALPNSDLRPMWPVYGVGRLRKQQLVKALPDLFDAWAAAVNEQGKADTPAGQRVSEIAQALTH